MGRNCANIGTPTNCGDEMAEGSPNVFVDGTPLSRRTDKTAGHCFPPTPISGDFSPTVIVNGLNAGRLNATCDSHCCGPPCHVPVLKPATTVILDD